MKFDREDLKVMPLAAVGLAVGVAEVFVKPVLIAGIRKLGELAVQPEPRPISPASITIYSTGGEHE